MRRPEINEIRAAFGSLSNAVKCTRGDLPTLLFFLANPSKIAGFKPPKTKHRNTNTEFSQWLFKAAKEERDLERGAEAEKRRAIVLGWLIKHMNPEERLVPKTVLLRMAIDGHTITRNQFKEVIKGSIWRT